MHLNVDARDRKSISLFISTGCLRLERSMGRVSQRSWVRKVVRGICARQCAGQFSQCLGGRSVTALCARVIRGGCQLVQQGRVLARRRGPMGRRGYGQAYGPSQSEMERARRHACCTPYRCVLATARQREPIGANWVLVRWGTENALRCAVKMAPDSEPEFGDGFERSKKRFPPPPPSGGHSPRRSLGGVYFRITLSANAIRNALVKRYAQCPRWRTDDHSPLACRRALRPAHITA